MPSAKHLPSTIKILIIRKQNLFDNHAFLWHLIAKFTSELIYVVSTFSFSETIFYRGIISVEAKYNLLKKIAVILCI